MSDLTENTGNTEKAIDASFEAIEITTPTSKLATITLNRNEEVERILSKSINLNDTMIYHEPTCLICSSPYRRELEQIFLDKKSNKEVIQLFKDKTGKDIEDNVVANHVDHHMTGGIRELQKIEYLNRLKRLNSPNITTLERISSAYAVISERLLGINSIVPNGEESAAEIEKIKSSETSRLMSSLTNLLKIQAAILGEMKTTGELSYIPTKDFMAIFMDALREAKTEREKQIVMGLLDKLQSLAKKTQ